MTSRVRVGRHRGRRTAATAITAAVTAALLVAGCSEPADPPPPTSEDQPIAGSFEEAATIALGELFRIYGTDAAPAPVEVTGEIDTHDGQEVWRLDGTYEVTIDDQRRQQRWTMWIGPTHDRPLAVLDADGPA